MKTNWQTKKLDDACEVEYGTRVVNKKHGGSIYPVYGGGGATFFMDKYNREDRMVIARFAMSEQCTRFVKGKFFLNDSGLTVSPQNLKEISQDFLDLQLYFLNDYIYSLARGAAQKNLDVPAFRNLEISFPESLPEQKRIVEILDAAFEKIEKAKENAEKNLKNSKELFESYLQSVFANPGKDWEEKKLGEVCNFVQGVQVDAHLQKETKKENQVRFLRIIDFTQGNELPRYIDNPGEKYIIGVNDVSLVRYGASTGFVCRGLSGVLANNLFRVIPKNIKQVSNEFLFIFLKSPIFQNTIKRAMGGAAMPAISFGLVKDISFPIPSILEQKTIVKKLDSLSEQTKKLEIVYKQKLADFEELKKSVLNKAFTGEL